MFNKVTLIGMAIPVEFFWSKSSELVAVLTLISTEKFRSVSNPDLQTAYTRHRVVVVGNRAEFLRRRLTEPRPLLIEGQLRDAVAFMYGRYVSGVVICVTPTNGTIRCLDEIAGDASDYLPLAVVANHDSRISD